jgi:hypothetical protein
MTGVRRFRLLVLCAGVFVVAGCANPQTETSFTKPATTSASKSGVRTSLTVNQTAQVAGRPIEASLVITNDTGTTFKVPCGLSFAVGIGNEQIPYAPAFTMECSAHGWNIGPGRHSYEKTIQTNDGTFLRPTATNRFPKRPLPPGMYQTSIAFAGGAPAWMPLPPPITIRVTSK